jgi:hypothetical protein
VTERAGERPATPANSRPAVRTILGLAAIAAGIGAGWAVLAPWAGGRPAAGPAFLLAAMAVILATGNGYGKAYSP